MAKATFYDHFSSKEKLLFDYVCEMSQREFTEFREEVDSFDTAEKRFFGPLNILIPWLTSTGFRGCPFQNVVSEIPPGDKRIQRIIRKHHDRQREFLKELCAAYVAERPEYNEVDCDALAETYGLLFDGAIASAAAYRDVQPVEKAIATLKIVLGRNAQ